MKGPETVFTIGQIHVHPNTPSIVPGEVRFTVQMRDPQASLIEMFIQRGCSALADAAAEGGFEIEIGETMKLPPVAMYACIVAAITKAAAVCAPGAWRTMASGALHDATNMAGRLPNGMLYVPSIGGVIHNFAEDTAEADLLVRLDVLTEAVLVLCDAAA